MADTIRTHLARKHGKEWRKIVVMEKLKGWDRIGCDSENASGNRPTREQFTREGFLERLGRWIAVDDQVSPSLFYSQTFHKWTSLKSVNVVETQELRDLLLYLNVDLKDSDIPHRTKITQVIFESYHREWKKIVAELRVWCSHDDHATY
jgi:hypothetical protein